MQPLSNSNIIIHPQAEKLREQNRQLQNESVGLIVERDHLKNVVCPQIFAEYQSKIGALELRVFQLDCETRAMLRRIEMAQAALNRGEKPVYQLIEQEIRNEFAAWHETIERQAQEIKAAQDLQNLPVLSTEESRELHKLYRKLAFLLHPDINDNADEHAEKLWLQAAEAYQNGDLATLRILHLLAADASPENYAPEHPNILEKLKIQNIKLKKVCEKLLDEIRDIKSSTPYVLHKVLANPAEMTKLQNALREQIEILREKYRQLVEHWAEILRFAEDTENINIPAEPTEIFTDGTDEWADIIYEF